MHLMQAGYFVLTLGAALACASGFAGRSPKTEDAIDVHLNASLSPRIWT